MTIPSKIIPFPGSAGPPVEAVTFQHPFLLPGLDKPHRPGTYALRETRTPIDVSWPAHVVSLSLVLTSGAYTQVLDVTRRDLDEALRRDATGPT